MGIEATLLPGQTVSSSSNKEILTTSLLVSTVVEEAKEGYSIGVEVADGILEVSADSRVVSPLLDRLCR